MKRDGDSVLDDAGAAQLIAHPLFHQAQAVMRGCAGRCLEEVPVGGGTRMKRVFVVNR